MRPNALLGWQQRLVAVGSVRAIGVRTRHGKSICIVVCSTSHTPVPQHPTLTGTGTVKAQLGRTGLVTLTRTGFPLTLAPPGWDHARPRPRQEGAHWCLGPWKHARLVHGAQCWRRAATCFYLCCLRCSMTPCVQHGDFVMLGMSSTCLSVHHRLLSVAMPSQPA